ncbi:family regulatory protein [Colletotrichum incanum]|uniref:Family regulatory protein n=1 Tax=Colletotrichum incanum TaxID=1573173 RepID=A0A166MI10_COLIC|nr:family regulatory protein [Colletotrichum incanum]OHW90718.1 hypothetical protein CSPAE12_10684 [Colletotrichum incanum]
MPASDVSKKPLSYLASEIRRSIAAQDTRDQIEAYSSLVRQNTRNKSPPLFGDGSMELVMCSNWHKANVYGFDVSAAAVKPRDTPLLPSYVQNAQGPYNFADGIMILGKDTHGNYWLSGHKAEGEWGAMMRKMMEDS